MSSDSITLEKKTLSELSHDLKNPIGATQLFLELLLKEVAGPLTEKQKEILKDMQKSQEKMLSLLETFKSTHLSS